MSNQLRDTYGRYMPSGREKRLSIRITVSDQRAIRAQAKARGLTISDYVLLLIKRDSIIVG